MTTYVPPKFSIADVFKSSKKIRDEIAADAYMYKMLNEAKLKQVALAKELDAKQEKPLESDSLKEKQTEKDRKKSSPTPELKPSKDTKSKAPVKANSDSSTTPPSPHKHKKQRRKSPSPQPARSRSASISRAPSDVVSYSSQTHRPVLSHPMFHPPATPWGYHYMTAPEYNAGVQYPITYAGSGVYQPAHAHAHGQAQAQAQAQPDQPDPVVQPTPASSVQEIRSTQPPESVKSEPSTAEAKASESTSAPAPAPHIWTTEQDACLEELKKKGCTWNSISRTLNIPKQDCRGRWAEIRPVKERNADGKKNQQEEGVKKEKKDEKPTQGQEECQCNRCRDTENKKEETVPKEQTPERKKDEESPNKAKKPENKRSVTFAEPLKLKPALKKTNESYDLQEMLLLHQLAEKFEREKWLRVSSRFFDLTGRRITPLDAKSNVAMEM